jgi:hypothetical protein
MKSCISHSNLAHSILQSPSTRRAHGFLLSALAAVTVAMLAFNAWAGQIGGVVTGPYAWTNLDGGVNNTVFYGMAYDGTNLFAGGHFTTAGSVTVNYVAKWNGTNWSSLGIGMDDRVLSLLMVGTNLYAAGDFTMAGGVSAYHVARWDGTSWSPVGMGMNNTVNALAYDGTYLYAGGDFTLAGGVSANNLARWDGANWSSVGGGMGGASDSVRALVFHGTDLYVGGMFTTAGGVPVSNMAKWDGASWSDLGGGMDFGVFRLELVGTTLYAGGAFTTAGGASANRMAKWDGSTWTSLGTGMDSTVFALANDGINLYAGGSFTTANNLPVNYVAMWNGTTWTNLGKGTAGPGDQGGRVLSLLHDGTSLYAGGWFTNAGVALADHIAKWAPQVNEYSGVDPASGIWTGGTTVTITGSNLGNGADITDVTLCGVSVASITSQSATQVVVVAAAGLPGLGDVRVFSTSQDETVKSNGFTYVAVTTVTAGPTTWGGGNSYAFGINSATGTAGTDPGWGLLNITGTLDITATSGNKFTMYMATLTPPGNVLGVMDNFNNTQSYSWAIAQASGGIIGFAPDRFILNTNGVANDLNGGQLTLTQVGNEIRVNFSPEGNNAPVAKSIAAGVRQGQSLTINASKLLSRATDADGNTIRMTGVSASSADVTLTLAAGVITYTPPGSFTGIDTFTYTISDGHGAADTATVLVTVTPTAAMSLNAVYGPLVIGDNFVVRFAGIPGYEYTVESTDSLIPATWAKKQNVTAPTTAGSFGVGVFEFSEATGGAPSRFYRTVWPAY